MAKKLVIIILIGVILSFGIYKITFNDKLNLLALGDGIARGMTAYNVNGYSYNDYIKDYFKEIEKFQSYNNIFTKKNLTTEELNKMIKRNISQEINGEIITIQQAISQANVITIGIGMDELANASINKVPSQKVVNDYYLQIKELLTLVKKYNNKKVIVLSLYDAFELKTNDINNQLKNIVEENNCIFLDITTLITNSEYYFSPLSYYFNYKGHKNISDAILKMV